MAARGEKKEVIDSDSDSEPETGLVSYGSTVPFKPCGGRSDVPKPVFLIDFLDGYSIRQLLEIIKLILTSCPIYLTKEGISIQNGNGHRTAILSSELYQHNCAHYFLDPALVSSPEDGDTQAYHIICPNIGKLRDAVKPVARREGVRLIQYYGDPFIYVQIHGGTKNADGSGQIVPLEHYEPIAYDLEGYRQSFSEPNCKISLAEFCGFCAIIVKIRGIQYVEFRSYLKGVWIMPLDTTGSPVNDKKWGDCDDSKQVPIIIRGGPRIIYRRAADVGGASYYSIKVSIDIIKGLSKMVNLSPNGILRIYAEKNRLLRLQTNVNYYGPITFYLRESDEL